VIENDWSVCSLVRESIVQNHIQKCFVNMDSTVVGNVSEPAEVVHEFAYARAGGADQVGELHLGDRRDHALRFTGLAKVSHDEQCSCETLLAVVEQLIDKILTSPDPPKQDKLQEDVGKLMLFVQKQHHLLAA